LESVKKSGVKRRGRETWIPTAEDVLKIVVQDEGVSSFFLAAGRHDTLAGNHLEPPFL
jgi:hypothetical protein